MSPGRAEVQDAALRVSSCRERLALLRKNSKAAAGQAMLRSRALAHPYSVHRLIEADHIAEWIKDVQAQRIPGRLVQPRPQVAVLLLRELAMEILHAFHL